MRRPAVIYQILFFFIFDAACLHAARNRPSYEEDRSVIFREILDCIDTLRHEVNNHEAEIRMFEEKFKTQDDILDSLRHQTTTSMQAVKDSVKGQSVNVESKLAGHESLAQSLSNDFKSFAKDSTQALVEYKARLADLEKTIETQNRNIENLQAAMKSLLEAMQMKESGTITQEATKIYRVKSGDSLEKIAKQNQTTIKKLKELNNLTSDQIIINQKLKLSE
jgi:LysM repeat protein